MPDVNQLSCPHCGQSYQVEPTQWAQYHGRTINCTKCGQPFVVSAPQELIPPAPAGSPSPLPPAYPPGAQSPLPYGTYAGGGPTTTSGWAITSLIVGIVGLCIPFIGPIIAIVAGILGILRTGDPRVRGRGLAIAGVTLGGLGLLFSLAVVPLQLSLILPALNRAREQANRIKCASNMKQIGLAAIMYANNHNRQFPDSLETLLSDQDLTSAVFVCPSSRDVPAAGPTTRAVLADLKKPGHESFIYVGSGLMSDTAGPNDVVLYEPLADHGNEGMNVLFGDGAVKWLTAAEAQPILRQETAGGPIKIAPPPGGFSAPQ